MKFARICIVSIFFCFCIEGAAQTDTIRAKMFWADYFIFNRINPKFRFYSQVGYRNLISDGKLQQIMIRPCFDYRINQTVGIHAGVLSSYTAGDENIRHVEIRPWQGVVLKWPQPGRFYFQHFFRIEERFFFIDEENAPFTVRMRFQTGVKIPLNNYEITNKTWFIRPYVEFFSEIGTQDVALFPNLTRFNFTLGYKFNPKWIGELTFMQHRARETRIEDYEFRDYVFRIVARHFINRNGDELDF